VSTTDPLTYLTSALVLAAATITAALVPAYRAARTDPMQAIREQ
jgi:ABC-type antimicrobial peptide transport system permease subunit